uniref:Uncharacterized protein n=1 Tax=Helianthus annuus TaxID=4232 RepID=A0A251VIH2_HELAN
MKSFKLGPVSDEDEKNDENSFSLNSNSWRSESSSSFGSCGSIGDETTTTFETTNKKNETKSYVEKLHQTLVQHQVQQIIKSVGLDLT